MNNWMKMTSLGFIWVTILLSLAALPACTRPCPPDFEPIELPEFIFGVGHGKSTYIPYVEELGMTWMRPNLSWRTIEPEIEIPELTVEDVPGHEEQDRVVVGDLEPPGHPVQRAPSDGKGGKESGGDENQAASRAHGARVCPSRARVYRRAIPPAHPVSRAFDEGV